MKTITYNDIASWMPCYDPVSQGKITADWSGTAIDFLNLSNICASDKVWTICREELISKQYLRQFSIWCANQMGQTNQVAIDGLNTAMAYMNKTATDDDRMNAYSVVHQMENVLSLLEAKKLLAVRLALGSVESNSAWGSSNLISYLGSQIQVDYLVSLFNSYGL